MRAWLSAVVVVAACGNGGGSSGDDDAQDAAVVIPDVAIEPGYEALILRNWQLNPGIEDYICKRIKIEEDVYVSAFKPIVPNGTHHAIVTISPNPGLVGDFDCTPNDHDRQLLFGGGAGTSEEMPFPPGVAIKLPKGSYVTLNLHVFNLSDTPISGTSGLQIKKMQASEVVHEADMMFLGTFELNIPPTNTMHMEPGSCSIPAEWYVFNLWPHMHKWAKHQKVTVRRDNGAIETLLDVDYQYTEQRNYPRQPLKLNINDEMRVECYYINDTNITQPPGFEINYGDSALAEMCFTGFYKYPKGGDIYNICSSL